MSLSLPFIPGGIYHRRQDIHAVYGGQQGGGIATPADYPCIFLFTADAGIHFGYEDGYQDDGLYWYTGEGQHGDMRMVRGNVAIREHLTAGKTLLLFEAVRKAYVRFAGPMAYLDHHWTQRPDADGVQRQAIVFHLEAVVPESPNADPKVQESAPAYSSASKTALMQLRQRALAAPATAATVTERRTLVRQRAQAVKAYALARAADWCEGCQQPAPFHTKKGPFLEVHHTHRLADGGPDHPDRVIALCPNCHRRAHHAIDAKAFNERLQLWLQIQKQT